MKVKIKKLYPGAIIPSYANPGDAGLDLTCESRNSMTDYVEYFTGLCIEIPEGYVGLIFPRSSISNKDQMLTNSVGVIDSGYRGEIKFRFKTNMKSPADTPRIYEPGDKLGQLLILPYPQIELEEVEELSNTERGESGFGSSGS